MSEYKTYRICYTMVDGEVFKRSALGETYEEIIKMVHDELKKACFGLRQRPEVILVSANVRNVDVTELHSR
jgi:hypothetical protein